MRNRDFRWYRTGSALAVFALGLGSLGFSTSADAVSSVNPSDVQSVTPSEFISSLSNSESGVAADEIAATSDVEDPTAEPGTVERPSAVEDSASGTPSPSVTDESIPVEDPTVAEPDTLEGTPSVENPVDTTDPTATPEPTSTPTPLQKTPSAKARDMGVGVQADPGTSRIMVRTRLISDPTSVNGNSGSRGVLDNVGVDYTYLPGTRYQLFEAIPNTYKTVNGKQQIDVPAHAGSPIRASWATCTVTGSATDGTGGSEGRCDFIVPNTNVPVRRGGNLNRQFFVKQIDPVSGSPAALHTYANSSLLLKNFKSPDSVPELHNSVGITPPMVSSQDMYLPRINAGSTGGTPYSDNEIDEVPPYSTAGVHASFGAVANSLNNPSLSKQCTGEQFSVAVVLDHSSSIDSTEWNKAVTAIVGAGNNSLLGVLQDKAKVSIGTFSTTSKSSNVTPTPQTEGWTTGPTPVAVTQGSRTTIRNALLARPVPLQDVGYNVNFTNWDDALHMVNEASTTFDLVIFVTDGIPNFILPQGYPVDAGFNANGTPVSPASNDPAKADRGNTTLRSMEAAIYEANKLKQKGTRVLGVGVDLDQLPASVNANLAAISGPVLNQDYYRGSWDQLQTQLKAAVTDATACVANVVVKKRVVDPDGLQVPKTGWSVNTMLPSGSSATRSPNSSQTTAGDDATASWKFTFGSLTAKTSINVLEGQSALYEFASGVCTVRNSAGTVTQTVNLANGNTQSISNVGVGDRVECTYVNRLKPATVLLAKQVQDVVGQNAQPAKDWTLGATLTGDAAGRTITSPATQVTGNNGQTPNVWTVSFPEDQQNLNGSGVKVSEVKQTGYTYQSLVCQVTPLSGGNVRTVATSNLNTSDGNMVSAVLTSLTPGEKATCTFTNKPDPGSVSWTKTDASTMKRPLKGAEWTIIGPSPATTAISVTDCVANVDSACLSSDKDRRAGYFKVTDLAWGQYKLVETKAPAGYQLDSTEHPFVVAADNLDVVFNDPFENTQREVPMLPLTGGLGRDAFLIVGGGILLVGIVCILWLRFRPRRR